MKIFVERIPAFLFCSILLFTLAIIAQGNPENLKDKTQYSVTVGENNQRLLKVTAQFRLHDNQLYMSPNGAGQFPERWAKFVRNLKVSDPAGKALKFKELTGARWSVEASQNQKVTIEYEIVLDHEKHTWPGGIDGVAFAKDWGVFYTGRSFLIMNGTDRNNIELKFNLPPKWHISGSWKQKTKNTFTSKNLTDLSESMFFAGTHEEFSIKRDGFELLFALGGDEIISQKDSFRNLAQGVMDYYIELMGGIPTGPPANKFEKSIVIINSGEEPDGEVIGDHINMIFNPKGGEQSKMMAKFIFAHEFFHLWNGKSIRVANTTEDWFKEGVTSYYTLKALNHVGSINDEAYFGILNNLFYQRYRSDEGYGKFSMRDMATESKKDKHWGLIYGGGLFAGLCQDINLRHSTENKKSLDDLMRDFYKTYAGSNQTYTTLDLQNHLKKLGGTNQEDFFKQHIFGVEAVPITQCLSTAGLNAKIDNGQLKIEKNPQMSGLQQSILNGVFGR
jgi:predicted metalloprotease with PDZ domain